MAQPKTCLKSKCEIFWTLPIETDVNALLRDLSAAIAEADRFIQTMGS